MQCAVIWYTIIISTRLERIHVLRVSALLPQLQSWQMVAAQAGYNTSRDIGGGGWGRLKWNTCRISEASLSQTPVWGSAAVRRSHPRSSVQRSLHRLASTSKSYTAPLATWNLYFPYYSPQGRRSWSSFTPQRPLPCKGHGFRQQPWGKTSLAWGTQHGIYKTWQTLKHLV